MSEWQPIETAPKKDEPTLVWDFDNEEAVFASFYDFAWRVDSDVIAASHWLPITSPPEAVAAKCGAASLRATLEEIWGRLDKPLDTPPENG